jgi:hypothetical protein
MLNIACLLSPEAIIGRFLFPSLWVWPVFLWSQMGVRENRHRTGDMVFSSPNPVRRQLPAVWLAGVVLTLLLGMGGWMRLMLMGEILRLMGWFVGALFVPALAVTLGVWMGNRRFFEFVYLFVWYIGLVEHMPVLDFAGTTTESVTRGMPWIYFIAAVVLLGIALFGRARQLNK